MRGVRADSANVGEPGLRRVHLPHLLGYFAFFALSRPGAHRALGPSVSRVRSTTLDNWLQENIELMDNLGNQVANQYWEFSLS